MKETRKIKKINALERKGDCLRKRLLKIKKRIVDIDEHIILLKRRKK